jgi:hypothetical protein
LTGKEAEKRNQKRSMIPFDRERSGERESKEEYDSL